MNINLKLGNLASPRYTRSMKNKVTGITNSLTKTEYFGDSKDAKRPKVTVKKRLPIKVEFRAIPKTETKVKRLPKAASSKSPGTKSNEKWKPENWQLMLSNIKEMRKDRTAPVDQIGSDDRFCGPEVPEPIARFQALVGAMLSSQTKDQVTHAAMQRLKSHGCTPTNIISTSDETLGKLIHPVGLWRRKVGYIKRTTEILLAQYGGDIPKTIDGLCKLPGVGPKMAHICMQVAWGEVPGITVDTHVHRISNRIGWVQEPTKTAEQTRVQLESWLPKEEWTDINYILVGFGQEICTSLRPKCDGCLNSNICPYAKSNRVK